MTDTFKVCIIWILEILKTYDTNHFDYFFTNKLLLLIPYIEFRNISILCQNQQKYNNNDIIIFSFFAIVEIPSLGPKWMRMLHENTIGLGILKSIFSEIRVMTWVQVVSRPKNVLWLDELSWLPIKGLFFWQEITWTHVLTRILEKNWHYKKIFQFP